VKYNAAKNEPTIVWGLGGYYNKKPLSSARHNKETRKIDKLNKVIVAHKNNESNPLIAKTERKNPQLTKIMEDVEELTTVKTSTKYKTKNNKSRNSPSDKSPSTEFTQPSPSPRSRRNSRLIRSVSATRLAVSRLLPPPTPQRTQPQAT